MLTVFHPSNSIARAGVFFSQIIGAAALFRNRSGAIQDYRRTWGEGFNFEIVERRGDYTGPAHTHDVQYLRVFIGQLCQKIEPDPADPALILTESGIGYRYSGESNSKND